MSFGQSGQRALLYSFSFLHPDSPKINKSVLCLFSELYFNMSEDFPSSDGLGQHHVELACTRVFSLCSNLKNNWK